MDILCIEMKLLMMMNKLHIFTPLLRLISLVLWDDTLLSSFCNICFQYKRKDLNYFACGL